jgi:hypothetical protein
MKCENDNTRVYREQQQLANTVNLILPAKIFEG